MRALLRWWVGQYWLNSWDSLSTWSSTPSENPVITHPVLK